jgi:sigma-B regulation protein RsbU (phosphoserine phosphatase)
MKLIVADDEPVSLKLLVRTLQKWKYEVASCANGEEAWKEYLKGESHVVISNWVMPGMDGIELCKKIRAQENDEYTYIILLTGKKGRDDFLQGMSAGADDYLTKPLAPLELKVRLEVAARILALKSDVRVLRGILPICAWCKKIRDDEQLWHDVEEYISIHTGADFSHSICPSCHDQVSEELEVRRRARSKKPIK